MFAGMGMSGNSGVSSGTTISNIIDSTSFDISNPATSSTTQTYSFGWDVTVGVGNGAAGTIQLASNQTINSLTINAAGSGNYIFGATTGTPILTLGGQSASFTLNSSATFDIALNATNTNSGLIATIGAGQTLTLNAGGTILASGFTAGNTASTVAVTGGATTIGNGTWNIGSASAESGGIHLSGSASVSAGGGIQIGNGNGGGYVQIDTGATLASTGSGGQISIGRNATSNVAKVWVNGGTLSSTSTNAAPVFIGRGSGTGTLKVTSGTVNATQSSSQILIAADTNSTGTLDISGGVVSATTIAFHGANSATGGSTAGTGTGTINLSGTGALYIGAGGIVNRQTDIGTVGTKVTINLSGGTVGAIADWSSSLDMNLVSGNTMIKAADGSNAAHNISLSGALTGAGGLTKSGGGTLTLSGANTYAGGTTVNAGTLTYANSFTMQGANQITLGATGAAGTDYATVISSGASTTLTTGGTLAVNFSSSFLSGGESFSLFQTSSGGALAGIFGSVSVTGSYIAALTNDGFGVWSGSGSGLNFTFNNSTGAFTVSAIPEPSTYAMIFGMLAFVGVCLRRRRAAAKAA